MPTYVIERTIPDAGKLSKDELGQVAQRSCDILRELGPAIQWVQSYVTADKVYCVYRSPNEALIREHAVKGGFPVDEVAEVGAVLDPTSAEA